MPNEIYHRSNWGESKAEGFGDVYYDHAATNKLYNHSDYYENSDGTDATLKDLNNKASIVLTPTAYSDGSLNTVIPPYQVLPTELVTNETSKSINTGGVYTNVLTNISGVEGQKLRITFSVSGSSGTIQIWNYLDYQVVDVNTFEDGTHYQDIIVLATSSSIDLRFYSPSGRTGTLSNISAKLIQEADFDFSRGSSATRVNEQGLVEDVQILSGELVQNGNFEQIGSELVTNGNFSDGLTGWNNNASFPVDYLSVVDDRLELENINGGTQVFTSDSFSVTANKIYKISLDTIKVSGADDFDITLRNTPLGTTVETITTTQQTGELIYYFKSASTQSLVFQFTLRDTIKGSIDNVSVKEVGQNWTFGTGWSMGDGKVVADGTMTASDTLNQSYNFTDGNKYRFKFTVSDYQSGSVYIREPFNGGADAVSANGTFTFDYIAGSANEIRFRSDNGFIGSLDNVSIKEVTDDTDLPRIDFTDGTGSLLLEPSSINVITYSEDFSQSIWSKIDVLIEDGYTAPDGSNTAYKVTENGSNAHLVILGSSISPVNRHKSIWARTVSGTGTIQLLNHNTDTGNTFTLTTQWQRFDLAHASLNNFYAVDFRKASTTLSEVVLWGAQMEDLSYATSYIPTSGSSVTRSADVANNSGNADLFNDSEGVLYAEIAALADDQTYREIAISDGTSNNRIEIRYTNTSNTLQSVIRSGGTVVMLESTSSYNITNFNKIAVSYKANEFKMYVNSTEVAVDTSGNAPTGLKELAFDDGNGANDFYGDVKCIAVFKEALSNDLLERLTGEGYESFRLLAEANNYTII